jgi:hypothetical protein
MGDLYYCDDYEAITGRERDGNMPVNDDGTISTKVVAAPEPKPAKSSTTPVETK